MFNPIPTEISVICRKRFPSIFCLTLVYTGLDLLCYPIYTHQWMQVKWEGRGDEVRHRKKWDSIQMSIPALHLCPSYWTYRYDFSLSVYTVSVYQCQFTQTVKLIYWDMPLCVGEIGRLCKHFYWACLHPCNCLYSSEVLHTNICVPLVRTPDLSTEPSLGIVK